MEVELAPELREMRQALRRFVTPRAGADRAPHGRDEHGAAGARRQAARRRLSRHAPVRDAWRRRFRPVRVLPDARRTQPRPPLFHPRRRLLERPDARRPSPGMARRSSRRATCPASCKAAPAPPSRSANPTPAPTRPRCAPAPTGSRAAGGLKAASTTSAAAARPISSCSWRSPTRRSGRAAASPLSWSIAARRASP